MESLFRDAHRLCFDGPNRTLTIPCRVVFGRFQPSHVDLTGKTRPFDPYEGTKSLLTYFGIALPFVAYFSRVAAPDEYHLSAVAKDGGNMQRPKEFIEATDEQLAVWQSISHVAYRIRVDEMENNNCDEDDENKKLKNRLWKLRMLLTCHTTGARQYQSHLLSFRAMLNINPSTQSWFDSGNFNSSLSAIVWVIQLLVFRDSASRERKGHEKTLMHVMAYCDQ